MALLAHLRRINQHNINTLRSQPLSELSGSLGDLGTLLPLLLALTLTESISLSSTLVFSGLANILTGILFGIPLPVQPMKAIASIAISSSYSKAETASAGLFVAGAVTLFSITGLLHWFSRVVPTPVVRGIQVGAGLSLVISAGTTLLQPLGWTTPSWADNNLWAIFAFVALLLSSLRSQVPYALLITLLGLLLSALRHNTTLAPSTSSWLWHPSTLVPSPAAFRKGALQAGIPQLPLTTLNSILAVTSLTHTLTPPVPYAPSTTELGLSVGLTNLVGVWFAAMPVCHGSGGLAAQHRFGARSGASVVVLGALKLALGLFGGDRLFVALLEGFPRALLGVMVLAAGVELAKVGREMGEQIALWEGAVGDGDGDGDAEEERKAGRREMEGRWMVMLVTVAGCLAFKNDAVGFVAGMLWHWGLVLKMRFGREWGVRTWWRRSQQDETQPLLNGARA